MTDKEIEEAREVGRWMGEIAANQSSLLKRVSRLENGFLAVLTSLAYTWAKHAGFLP